MFYKNNKENDKRKLIFNIKKGIVYDEKQTIKDKKTEDVAKKEKKKKGKSKKKQK